MGEPEGKGAAPKGADKPKKPDLPPGTPGAFVQFVDCTAMGIKLKGGKLPWIKGSPKASFAPGKDAGTVNITLSLLGLEVVLPTSVKNGKLSVETKDVPDLSGWGAAGPKDIQKWIDEFNAWLRANGFKLGPLEVKTGVLTITKVAIGGAGKAEEPKQEPKKEEPKVKTGAGWKAAAGAGTLLLGTFLGTALTDTPVATSGSVGEAVPVSSATDTGGDPAPVEFHVPEGGLSGTMTITGPGGSFDSPFTLEQAANLLRLDISGNTFIGEFDGRDFLLESDRGFFDGSIADRMRLVADHRFDGQDFTAEGAFSMPLVEGVADGGDAVADAPLAGTIPGDAALGGEEGDGGGMFDPYTLVSITMILLGLALGAGILLLGWGSGAEEDEFQKTKVERPDLPVGEVFNPDKPPDVKDVM